MRRTISTLLGLAAATAVIAAGAPVLATSASAATVTASTTASDYDDYWGYDYSKYYDGSRAKAKGRVWSDGSDRIHVQGKLYDKYSPSRLCGYAQVKFENEDGDETYYWARKCGSSGYGSFHFANHDVDNVQVRVCYWDNHQDKRKYCGKWDYIYEADGGDDE
ncbi:hypothetical protein [Streptosporangium sp. NBC_01756]|uniref:hypothetical protein n=1 Tax=Streptosporangium sp. NBC_01756 TaxID=2975950 RepID=UPI002DDB1082|nr:hypothetical protein [Streptosporangium sp. NBC_01756]WSC90149.1 hypothetical protein OIE48_18780 [Streptosporangium sp. NBC_01756]